MRGAWLSAPQSSQKEPPLPPTDEREGHIDRAVGREGAATMVVVDGGAGEDRPATSRLRSAEKRVGCLGGLPPVPRKAKPWGDAADVLV